MSDTIVEQRILDNQGKWVLEITYQDKLGYKYTVWTDGGSEVWYRDIFKDLAD